MTGRPFNSATDVEVPFEAYQSIANASTGWPEHVWTELYDDGLPAAARLIVAHELRRLVGDSADWPDWVCDSLLKRATQLERENSESPGPQQGASSH